MRAQRGAKGETGRSNLKSRRKELHGNTYIERAETLDPASVYHIFCLSFQRASSGNITMRGKIYIEKNALRIELVK